MANTTVEDVMTDAAGLLGDPDLDIFGPIAIRPAFKRAYGDLVGLLLKWGLPLPKRTTYVVLPPYTSQVSPYDFGIDDMGEPEDLSERPAETVVTVDSIANGSPRVVSTVTDHGLASNTIVTLGAVRPASLAGRFFITSTGARTLELNGTDAGEEYVGGGVLSQSSQKFKDMTLVDEVTGDPTATLSLYSWRGEVFSFRGSSNTIELKLNYISSGSAPQSGDINIDGSYDFLVAATAGYAGPMYGQTQRGIELREEAFGPEKAANGSGGKLRDLVLPMLQTKNRRVRRPAPFRPHKNHASPYWAG